ncbi:hypothetical protein ABZS88_35920 [Streptomyces sp. NPDC005480]|uniref:hypothetical protein n=1 Tax=Streptomyces sp. NPDC005480 TaxID=3154880 RepID=UPI0033B90A1B
MVFALLAAGGVYGLPAARDWLDKQADERCQPSVTSYEKTRAEADGIRIPLIMGAEFLNGDDELTDQDVLAAYRKKREQPGEGTKITLAHPDCFDPQAISRANQIPLCPKTATFIVMPSAAGGQGSPWAVLVFDRSDGMPERGGLPPDLRLRPTA